MHIAEKFERLLDTYRRPDGGRWNGAELQEATGGVVIRSYVSNLRKGRIENPGYEKLAAIAKAMGFPPQLWFEEGKGVGAGPAEGSNLAARVEHLFGVVKNPKTGEPYTDAKIARLSVGDLTEEVVEGIRAGRLPNPTADQVSALAAVFGVEPGYLLDQKEPPLLDGELVEALRDEAVREVARETSRLPERERRMVLGIVRQFGETLQAVEAEEREPV